MSRCIVFDQPTADAVQSRSGIRAEIQADHPDGMMASVLNSSAAVAIIPAADADCVLLMRISRPQVTAMPARASSHMAPTGFLGLSDSVDMDSEPDQPRKWWQKILD